MSNGNDTWMPLYIGDYLGDTMELDGAQHGAYLLLLMYYWRNGSLPTDDVKLAQIARTESRTWKKVVGPVVKAFFHEKDGRLHQKRADLELAKAGEISAKRRAAAEARWGNGHHPPPDRHANADASASCLHGGCTNDADANSMLRARALPSPSQLPRERTLLRSGADAAAPNPRDAMWSDGLDIIRSLTGMGDRPARSFLGRLLREVRDDCSRALALLRDAERDRPINPAAWLIAHAKPFQNPGLAIIAEEGMPSQEPTEIEAVMARLFAAAEPKGHA